MIQLLQHLRSGEMQLIDCPAPQVGRGQVLIRSVRSLISVGTEKMLLEFGQANLVQKARQQPEKLSQFGYSKEGELSSRPWRRRPCVSAILSEKFEPEYFDKLL